MNCIFCGSWFSSTNSNDKTCMTCERAIRQLHLDITAERLSEFAQAEHDGRLVVLPCNDPLTLEELREMDGEPVWVVCTPDADGERLSIWALVSVEDEIFLQNSFGGRSAYEDVATNIEAIYRRKPEADTPKASPDWCDHIKKRFEKVN